jgi:hypothetical protein
MTILIDYLTNQKRLGFSPIVLFTGRQRMGKTALAMRIASEIDPDWNPNEYMMFRIEDFAEAYNKHNGKILILDEAGVSLDPYEHMSIQQRVYSHIVQTQAYKQNIVFLALPFASEIGKNHRKHVDAIVEVIWRGVYKLYRTSSWRSDLSQKPPRLELMEIVGGVPLPPKHIWDWYAGEGQKIYKENIMGLQNEILATRKRKLEKAIAPPVVRANLWLNQNVQ